MMVQPSAIASGLCCKTCGSIVSMASDLPGKPRDCHVCAYLATRGKRKGKAAAGAWKPAKRTWRNGRVYWVVSDGKGLTVRGKNGGESVFYDKSEAQEVADEKNAA